MGIELSTLRHRYDRIAIPTVWVAFALSLALHAVLLLSGWRPKPTMLPFEDPLIGRTRGALAVRIAPPPAAAPSPPPSVALPAPAPRSPAAPRPRPARGHPPAAPPGPRVLAREGPAASSAPQANAGPVPVTPSRAADLAALVESRRRARGADAGAPPSPPAETEQERHNRAVAANLGLDRAPGFGTDPKRGGGIFQVARIGYDSAEFMFYGWNRVINRNSQQMIEVQRGNNPSTELAVVRRMIAIIRDHERGDFVWESRRLGRDVWLSARPADNSGLEDFLMREFFPHLAPRD